MTTIDTLDHQPGSDTRETRSPVPAPEASPVVCTLDIGGMTCASCVGRVEKALAKVDGVTGASVNLANETATVTYDPKRVTTDQLSGAVTRAGYTGTPRTNPRSTDTGQTPATSPTPGSGTGGVDKRKSHNGLRLRWITALTAGLGLMAVMYVPIYPDTMDWLMPLLFVIATIVQFCAGADIYQAAWAAAQHRATNMNTLVALGTAVAYGYSAFVTLWPGLAERWGLPLHVYFETALIVIALVLMGRWFEARAKDRTTGAIAALIGLAPKTARVVRRRRRGRRPLRAGHRRRPGPGPARREGPRGRRRRRRHLGGRRVHADRREPPSHQDPRRHRHRRHHQHLRHLHLRKPPRWAPTPPWLRSSASSRTPKAPRPRCSAWSTRSRRCSCRSSSWLPPPPSPAGTCSGPPTPA